MKTASLLVARGLNAIYFVAGTVYCLLSHSPFAYEQFIRPQLIGWLPDLVANNHWLYLATIVITIPTLVPALWRGTRIQQGAIAAYFVMSLGFGMWLTSTAALALAGPNPRTLIMAAIFPALPLALAIVDHIVAGVPQLERVELPRLFVAVTSAFVVSWCAYALLIPWFSRRAVGVELSPIALVMAMGISLAAHLMAAALIYLVAAACLSLAAQLKSFRAEYWAVVALIAIAIGAVFQRLVASALSLETAESWILSGWLSISLSATLSSAWLSLMGPDTNCTRLARSSRQSEESHAKRVQLVSGTGLATLALSIVGVASIALVTRTAVAEFDWNFLLQMLGVAVVWAIAFGWAGLSVARLITERRRIATPVCDALAVAMLLVGLAAVPLASRAAALTGDATLQPEFVLDRYTALDGSYMLLRALLRTNAAGDSDYFSYLKANSTLGKVSAAPVDVDFVDQFKTGRTPPHIFLFIIDSLRRDYLSPYNPAVSFTPNVAAFASESVVFERAFTRYGATGLSVPAMWTGGMLLHKQYVRPFPPMNALEKLLDGVGYRRFMSDDHLVELFHESPATTLLDREIDEMDHTVCSTVRELEMRIDTTSSDPRPMFAMTRPLQLHVARLARDPEQSASAYPGFSAKYANQVAALDRCFGEFVDYLKRSNLFDDSVVILTSDHGESLGEEGRFGHAYTLHPEVVQIPLIMHVPRTVAESMNVDPSAIALSTDITPTLYAFADQPPMDRGVLYGAPLFWRKGTPPRDRRRDSFLLVSSYGPVYAMLRHNGRSLYISNAIDGRDLAYEMRADGTMERLTLTNVMRMVNRRLIREHIGEIANEYGFTPAF